MKRLFTLITSFLFFLTGSYCQTQIHGEDFESSGGYSTSVAEFTDSIEDYFIRTDGSDIASAMSFTNKQGSFFFGAHDTDGDGGPVNLFVDISNIGLSAHDSLLITLYIAEDDDASNQDWDASSYFHVLYDLDNSGSWTNGLWVEAVGGTDTEPAIDTDFDGLGDGTVITDAFTKFSFTIPSTSSYSELDLRFEINGLNAGDEDIAFDSVGIFGYGGSTAGGPEMDVFGNQVEILNNDNTPSLSDSTDFGTVLENQDSLINKFKICNNGDDTLFLTGAPLITFSGSNAAEFSVTTNPASYILPSMSTSFCLMFKPTGTGNRTATVSISNNDSDEDPYTFNVQGNGLTSDPELQLKNNLDSNKACGYTQEFGNAQTGDSINLSISVQNIGGGDLTISSLSLSGTDASEFTIISPSTPQILSPSGIQSITLKFKPITEGIKSATLTITNDDPDESSCTVLIIAESRACDLSDDFNRPDDTIPGNGWIQVGDDIDIISNELVMNTGGANGKEFAYQNMTSKYETTLGNASGEISWEWNMQQNRPNPSGFHSTGYGIAYVLGSSGSDFTSSTNGYAVVLGQSGSVDNVRLIHFSSGINGSPINLISSSGDFGNEHLSVKVTFDPDTDTWELFVRDDGTSFNDPGTLTSSHSEGNAINSTFINSNLDYSGPLYSHAFGVGNTGVFDNICIWERVDTNTRVQFTNLEYTSGEPSGTVNGTVCVEIENPSSSSSTTVDVVLTGGTATNGVDISSYSTTSLTFAVNDPSQKCISFTLLNDTISEGTETLVFSLQNESGGNNVSIGNNGTATVNIADDDITSFLYLGHEYQVGGSISNDEGTINVDDDGSNDVQTDQVFANFLASNNNIIADLSTSPGAVSKPVYGALSAAYNSVDSLSIFIGGVEVKVFATGWHEGRNEEDSLANVAKLTTAGNDGSSLQSSSPRPLFISGAGSGYYISQNVTGQNSSDSVRNAVRFDFSSFSGGGVFSFGLFGGDLETGCQTSYNDSCNNSPTGFMEILYADNSTERIDYLPDTILFPDIDWNGSENDAQVFGNRTTRFVGVSANKKIRKVLFVVGIDDRNGYASQGTDEVLSFISPIVFMDTSGPTRPSAFLPITLTNFDANALSNGNVLIQWTTASEINNKHFEVQRSMSGQYFQTISTVPGAGNSTSELNYSIIDNSPFQGVNYYRLKQVDHDGQFSFSKIKVVSTGQAGSMISLSPNPAMDHLTVNVNTLNRNVKALLNIYNSLGNEVHSSWVSHENEKATLDVSNYPSGIYWVKVEIGNVIHSLSFYKK